LVAAAAGFAAWRIVGQSVETASASMRPAWTGARVEEAPGLTIVRLAGSPHEKGLGHGTRLRSRIRALFEAVKPRDAGLAAVAISTGGQYFGSRLPQAYAEEIAGIAEGCGLSFEEVLYLNTRFDLRAYELAGGSAGGLGFAEAAAIGKGPEVLRLFDPSDLDGLARELIVFVHLDDLPLTLVGLPGMVGGFLGVRGIEERVGGALRPIQGAATPVLTGLPWPLFLCGAAVPWAPWMCHREGPPGTPLRAISQWPTPSRSPARARSSRANRSTPPGPGCEASARGA